MVRQTVFLVHGMGSHPSGWDKSFRKSFLGALRQWAPFDGVSAREIERDHVHFVPIEYDSVFEGYRERWRDGSRSVLNRARSESSEVGVVLDFLAQNAEEDAGFEDFFWSHLLDPLLWFSSKQARQACVAHVLAQVGAGLRDMYARERTNTAHVVAHSQGTSVIHDALIALRHWDGHEGLFDPAGHRWKTVAMVANVSRLLEARFKLDHNAPREAYKAYRSVLDPGRADTIVENFFNARHAADPFLMPRRFRPGNWPSFGYTDIEIVRFKDVKKVHDFEHYFEHPSVHLPILRSILGRQGMGTQAEISRVWNEYIQRHPTAASIEFDHLRDLFGRDPDAKLKVQKLATYLWAAWKELSA